MISSKAFNDIKTSCWTSEFISRTESDQHLLAGLDQQGAMRGGAVASERSTLETLQKLLELKNEFEVKQFVHVQFVSCVSHL
jgi:hypothetical protein